MTHKEPKFMQDLHKIREQISKECQHKSAQEVISSIRRDADKVKNGYLLRKIDIDVDLKASRGR